MIRLVYVSRSTAPAISMNDLAAILESSDRNNRQSSITGGLLINDTQIFQVLEGKAAAIDETFRRICADSRHEDVQRVWAGRVRGRLFENWAMVAVSVDPGDRLDIARVIDQATIYPHAAVSTLLNLIAKQRRAS
jgi:hypothetical protein